MFIIEILKVDDEKILSVRANNGAPLFASKDWQKVNDFIDSTYDNVTAQSNK